jgi:ParB family chromosome partitioning protein
MGDLESESGPRGAGVSTLPIALIRPNGDQPRRTFDPAQIADLAESIRGKGLLQPIIVRVDPKDLQRYQIVAGERRWRAAQEAKLHDVPVIVRELDDLEVLEIAIVENVQRVDLNPLEEAFGLQQLIDRFGHTQEKVAQALGKSRSHVANQLRLLKLPPIVQDHLREGRISAGHARALLTASDPEGLADRVVKGELSVRETERLAKSDGTPKLPRRTRSGADDSVVANADTDALAGDLTAAIGMPVKIRHSVDGKGEISIFYNDLNDLDRVCEALSRMGRAREAM